MALLEHAETGAEVVLLPRQLVGRSAACHLRLGSDAVSLEHAVLWWEDGSWWVKDLGSSNGTRVGTQRLEPGERARLRAGGTLELGDETERWRLTSAEAPGPVAVPLDGGAPVAGRGELLAVPDDERPDLVLHRTAGGTWLAESGETIAPVDDNTVVVAGGRPWRVHLPVEVAHTDRVAQGLRLPDVALHLEVSRNEEHVEARVSGDGEEVELPGRAHLYPLVVLARARLEDAELPEAERGWLPRDRFLAMLAVDATHLNVLLYRARRQLADAGVANVGALVERRASDRELRLGIAEVEVLSA